VAAEAITNPSFPSIDPYYVVSDIRSWNEVATSFGREIGTELSWTPFTDEQLAGGLKQNNFPDHLVDVLIEIGQGIATGKFTEHYFSLTNKPALGKTKLEDFAKEFASAYEAS
jgi:hypothetical protein